MITDLPTNFLIGEYAGALKTLDEFKKEHSGVFAAIERQRYAYDISKIIEEGLNLTIDAYGKDGNETAAINDPTGTSMKENCRYVEVLINGWPHVFVYTNTCVKKGVELLAMYGHSYFNFHNVMADTLDQCMGVSGEEEELLQIKNAYEVLNNVLYEHESGK